MLCHEVHGRGPTPFVGRAHLHRCHLVVSLPPSLQVDSIIEMSSHSLAARIPRHRCVPPPCFSPIEPICSRNIRWQKKKKKIIIMIRWTIRHNKCRCTHKKKKTKKNHKRQLYSVPSHVSHVYSHTSLDRLESSEAFVSHLFLCTGHEHATCPCTCIAGKLHQT